MVESSGLLTRSNSDAFVHFSITLKQWICDCDNFENEILYKWQISGHPLMGECNLESISGKQSLGQPEASGSIA